MAQAAVEKKLAACTNILPGASSIFWWENKIDKATEAIIFLKTKRANFQKIVKLIKSLHSYEVPEIIALPIIAGEKKYLEWLNGNLR